MPEQHYKKASQYPLQYSDCLVLYCDYCIIVKETIIVDVIFWRCVEMRRYHDDDDDDDIGYRSPNGVVQVS